MLGDVTLGIGAKLKLSVVDFFEEFASRAGVVRFVCCFCGTTGDTAGEEKSLWRPCEFAKGVTWLSLSFGILRLGSLTDGLGSEAVATGRVGPVGLSQVGLLAWLDFTGKLLYSALSAWLFSRGVVDGAGALALMLRLASFALLPLLYASTPLYRKETS